MQSKIVAKDKAKILSDFKATKGKPSTLRLRSSTASEKLSSGIKGKLQLEAPKEKYSVGEGFVMRDKMAKTDAQRIANTKAKNTAIRNFSNLVERFNKNPTPTLRKQVQKAKAEVDRLRQVEASSKAVLQGYKAPITPPKPFITPKTAPESTITPKVAESAPPTTKIESTVKIQPKTKIIEPKSESGITKASKDINTELVNKGFDALSPEQQAKFDPITKKETVAKVSEFMSKDTEKATQAAVTGEVPDGVHKQVLFNAVAEHAIKTNDVPLLMKLAKSPIATELSVAGQTLGASGFNKPSNSFVVKLQEINKAKEAKIATKKQAMINQFKKVTKVELTPEEKSISKFLHDLAC